VASGMSYHKVQNIFNNTTFKKLHFRTTRSSKPEQNTNFYMHMELMYRRLSINKATNTPMPKTLF
jgi:hypothetical protein